MAPSTAAFSVVLAATIAFEANCDKGEGNMNGEYVLSSTPGVPLGSCQKSTRIGQETWIFDAYTPMMSTFYSQVWWSPLAPSKLPEEMVRKYDGKYAAIIGWEIDQVRKTAKGDVSVPISASYNHHYT